MSERFSQDLALRINANSLFEEIKNTDIDQVTIDFSSVHSMSRSFAHQYLKNREKAKKTIKEINISKNVQTMLDLARTPKKTLKPIDFSKAPTITI